MKKSVTIVARERADGTLERVFPDGRTQPLLGKTDWAYLDAMTDEEAEAAALADPDNPPLTEERLKRMKPVPRVKIIRRALGLAQEEFAARYRIPLGTLRDWEQGRSEPDQPARAYLRVIAAAPEVAARALKDRDAA